MIVSITTNIKSANYDFLRFLSNPPNLIPTNNNNYFWLYGSRIVNFTGGSGWVELHVKQIHSSAWKVMCGWAESKMVAPIAVRVFMLHLQV